MRRHHRHLCVESLEGRSLLSTLIGPPITALYYMSHHLTPRDIGADSLPQKVTGMTFKPSYYPEPVLGYGVTAELQGGGGPGYYVSSVTWSCKVNYDNITSSPGGCPDSGMSCILMPNIPGTYNIVAVVYYGSTNFNNPPPSPDVVPGNFTVYPPDTVTKWQGYGTPTNYQMPITAQDLFWTCGYEVGPGATGSLHVYATPFNFWNGLHDSGWSGTEQVTGNVVLDKQVLGLTPPEYAAMPNGQIAAPSESFTWTWVMYDQNNDPVQFQSKCGTLNWAWYKLAGNDWTTQ
jgi:hypothetical protein